MSHVCLQFGQCGNQLGHEFFSLLYNDISATNVGISLVENVKYCDNSINKWFKQNYDGKLSARAVLVDTERKVLKHIKEQMKPDRGWEFCEDNYFLEGSGGAANNWALGYKVKGPEVCDQVLDTIRRECEQCDRLESILNFASSAGGTGSGVGSYLTEQLRDEFSNKYLFNFVVLPYRGGEVVTQNFNTLFTISKLYSTSDAVFLFENDDIHKITTTQLEMKNVSFPDLNKVIAEQVASVFQPIENSLNISNSILNLTAHSDYKLLSIKSSPFVPATNKLFEPLPNWDHLKKNIIKALKEPFQIPVIKSKKSKESCDRPATSSIVIGNIFLYRGVGANSNIEITDEMGQVSNYAYARWTPTNSRSVSYEDSRKFLSKDRYATLVTNNSSTWSVVDNIVSQSWETFIHNAYVHQYSKYGLEKEDFLDMFLKTESIVKNYKNL